MTNAAPTILLIDDDQLILATLCAGLRAQGFNAVGQSDPEKALATIAASKPDLVILDYDMPRISGLKLVPLITESGDVPFMFLSAYNEEPIYREAVALGAVAYVVKPIDPQRLTPTIWAALETAKNVSILRQKSEELIAALNSSRDVSVVTGLLMERLKVSRERAYEGLRQHARKERQSLTDICRGILSSMETVDGALKEIQESVTHRVE